MIRSIKLKLFVWFLLVFSVFSIGFSSYLFIHQKAATLAAVDSTLLSKANVFAGLIEVYPDGRVDFEATEKKVGFERGGTIYDIPLSGHYYQVYFDDGRPLASSPSLGDFRFPVSFEKVSAGDYYEFTSGPDNEPLRVLSRKVSITIRDETYTFIIQAAESLRESYLFIDSLKDHIRYSLPVSLVAAGLGGLLLGWFSLRPLNRFSAEVGGITEKNLDKRLDEKKLDTELKGLAAAFNETLDNLENAFKQQQRFLSDVSHELRTPAAVIKSSCEIHLKKDREPVEYKKALGMIMKSADRMENMIESLLTLSRLEQKKYVFKKERIAIEDIITRSVNMLQPIAEKKKVTINTVLSGDAFIHGDRNSITEAFINIIENAIKYNHEAGTINITSEGKNGKTVIHINDTGIGMPEAELGNIFRSFYRVDPSRTSIRAKGAGLGLNIAARIIQTHMGKIDVASKAGEGTVFSVSLPTVG